MGIPRIEAFFNGRSNMQLFCKSQYTPTFTTTDAPFPYFQRFCSSKLRTVASSQLYNTNQLTVRFLVFSGFAVVNWYQNALKAVLQPSIILKVGVCEYTDTDTDTGTEQTHLSDVCLCSVQTCIFKIQKNPKNDRYVNTHTPE
jgi:hypothetical protein